MLLLEAGRVVPVNRLLEALWDDEPPRTARTQLQMIISGLRRLLEEGRDEALISTRPPGYVIEVAVDALDMTRFEKLVAVGTAAAGDGRLPDAAGHFRSALSLWRGPALAGVESRIVSSAATRLNETRLRVVEDCLDIELQLGRHRDVIAELGELVAEHPLRERMRAQLMIALYRSGRQAEALDTFREGREILLEELGLDPGSELRHLEQAILLEDDSLELPSEAKSPAVKAGWTSAVPVPRQLPAAAELVGREDLLNRVVSLLSNGDDTRGESPSAPVVVLTGIGGVGKTALALRAAHILREGYPNGQLFAPFHMGGGRTEAPERLLERILRSFGVAPDMIPSGTEDRAAMYRSWVAERRILIVIDDAMTLSQVTPLLPGTSTCAVLITTRNRLNGLVSAYQFEVGALDERAGVTLVAEVIGADRAGVETDSVRTLVELCDRLPLALNIAAAKLAARPHWRVGHLVRRLRDERQRLDELDINGVNIRATLSFSFDGLDDERRRLFMRLGQLGQVGFASWVAAPLLDCDVHRAENLLESLVDARLVEARLDEDGTVRYHLHDLVRIFALERLAEEEPTGERVASLRRLIGCWLFLAAEAHRREYGGDYCVLHGDGDLWPLPSHTVDVLLAEPLDWLRVEHTALVSVVFRAGQAGLDELCWDLAITSVTLFEAGSHVDDWRDTHECALDAVRAAGNRRGEAAMLYSLGTLALRGRLKDASRCLTQALRLFQELGDAHGRALSLGGLAFVDRLEGRYDLAMRRHEQALTDFQRAGDPVGEAHMLLEMAKIHKDRRGFDLAGECLHKALVSCRTAGARRVQAQVEYELAELYLLRDQMEDAIEAFKSVEVTANMLGDIVGQAYALLGVGVARIKQEAFAQAKADLDAAYALAGRTGDLLVRGRVLLGLGELDFAQGRPGAALSRLEEARGALEALGSAAVWQARVLEVAGRVHQAAGRVEAARDSWRAARELASGTDLVLAEHLGAALTRLDAEPPPYEGD